MPSLQFDPITDPQIFAEADRFTASLVPEPLAPEDDAATWAGITDMGWPLCLLPEVAGGLGADLSILAAIVEGAGRHAPAAPLVSGCAVVPILLAVAPEALLAGATSGIAENTWRIVPFLPAELAAAGPGLTGDVRSRHALAAPTHALLAQTDPARILLLDLRQAGLTHSLARGLDGRLSLELSLAGIPATGAALLAEGETAAKAIAQAEDIGAALTSLEAISAAGVALGATLDYLGERVQFGQKLASFQVLRQRFSGLYAEYLNARALVDSLLSGGLLEAHDGRPLREVALARLLVARLSRRIAQEVIQFHGGIGVTEELGVSRLNRRLLASGFEFGPPETRLDQLLPGLA